MVPSSAVTSTVMAFLLGCRLTVPSSFVDLDATNLDDARRDAGVSSPVMSRVTAVFNSVEHRRRYRRRRSADSRLWRCTT